MQNAWYRPSSLAPPPAGRPELADEEDEDGLLESVAYVEFLVDDLVAKGIPSHRIVVGGFSQGCAVSLLTDLTSRYSGKLAGAVGLMGYLPVPGRIEDLRIAAGLEHAIGDVPIFLGRGSADRLVPKSKWQEGLEYLRGFGANEEGAMEVHEYQGLGHSISPALLSDLDIWLQKVLPDLD